MIRLKLLDNKYRYKLLLLFILIYLIFPAFVNNGVIYRFTGIISLSFIFLQGISVFTAKRWQVITAYIVTALIIGTTWFSELFAANRLYIEIIQLVLYVLFFAFVLIALFRWLIKSTVVTIDSIIVAVAIYCLFGIIGGSLALLLETVYPGQVYKLPDTIQHGDLLDFTYYSFVTLTTLGYGDITPLRQESQTLSYMLAMIGQFYVAIIIAILVSQYIGGNKKGSVEDQLK
jgi:hypothetical protein